MVNLANGSESLEDRKNAPAYWIGWLLAAAIFGTWLAAIYVGLFKFPLAHSPISFGLAGLGAGLICVQIWLYAGLFIIAHDTMHGSFLPSRPKLNAALGQIILTFYAGFNWKKLRAAHQAHHDYSGTEKDPDFNAADPLNFWPWYGKWFFTYFGWAQYIFLTIVTLILIFLLNVDLANILVFWALPALLSSVQLFFFGTYLPHRHVGIKFDDEHNARSNEYSYWLSLLTCLHFGYHHEHHLYPSEPWWRLPMRRAKQLKVRR